MMSSLLIFNYLSKYSVLRNLCNLDYSSFVSFRSDGNALNCLCVRGRNKCKLFNLVGLEAAT